MTIGIGGSSAELELAKLSDMTTDVEPISVTEFHRRIANAQTLMKQHKLDALYLNAGTNLYYFTGTRWGASERMLGVIIPAEGEAIYISPHFELQTLLQHMTVKGNVLTWQEHESPYQLCQTALQELGISSGRIGIDESTAFFISNGIAEALPESFQLADATAITAGCRGRKSAAELALMQKAKDITMTVQRAAARILYEGITAAEVTAFIDQAHRKLGASRGSYFCYVQFGSDTAYPHGVKTPKALELNDMVLIDTGCQIEGYISDITRCYVFGTPSERQRQMWNHEKQAQQAAFEAAQLGAPCGGVDIAARRYLADEGFGPDYQTPGCPHRTGHGIGLDIHEWPYLVSNNQEPLEVGMCFSNEPMLVIPGEFGVRLEDHFYMTDNGPKWFTEPAYSIEDPFGYQMDWD